MPPPPHPRPQMIMVNKFETPAMNTSRENGPHKNYMFKVTGPSPRSNEAKNIPMHTYPLNDHGHQIWEG